SSPVPSLRRNPKGYAITENGVHSEVPGTDNQEKDEKQSQNDKTGLGMEKL
ncbi:hypothetical protein Tco_1239809, partial [Tanacetum coccineum]